jgi:hypothetical protein
MSIITKRPANWINTWISKNYCRHWGLHEGLRELLCNQYDGICDSIKKEKVEPEKMENGTDYLFCDSNNKDIIYGGINYDKEKQTLMIWNNGSLAASNLLLGGTKDIQNSVDIIGRFGEGMKLAALAFVREGKLFSIITGGKLWSFTQKLDKNFIKDGQFQNCLHWKGENINLDKYKDKVTVEIMNITLDEWIEQIDNFLWLTQRNVGKINAKDKNGNVIGQLLINPFFKNKIYVKDIFIQKTEENNGATSCYFGFNTDLTLDRDRNAVKNLVERNKKFSEIIGDIMNRRNSEEILKNLEPEEIDYFKNNYTKDIIYLLEHGFYTCSYINNHLTTESRNAIWNQKVLEDYINRKDKNIILASCEGGFLN